jgi:3-oxoacyl-[acyl-carrier-protein] synthase III
MRNTVIVSTGRYLPSREVTNQELDWFPAGAPEKISEKTGVLSRRSATHDECTSDLAAHAGRDCLEKAGLAADELEGIILSTSSPDRVQPATATRVQHLLGARRAFAFDINSVCSGSVYGISLADSLIKSGNHERILFIAAELYTRILNKQDFSTFPYFGDGAGAILFEAGSGRGVLHSVLRSDGSACDTISVPGGGTMMPFDRITNPRSAYFQMDGKRVYAFAIEKGAEVIRELLTRSGIAAGNVDLFVSHQANINIIHAIADHLEVPRERFFVNLDRYGNTASASVPIALDEALASGKAKGGDLLVTVAFGGGLSWGANLIRL